MKNIIALSLCFVLCLSLLGCMEPVLSTDPSQPRPGESTAPSVPEENTVPSAPQATATPTVPQETAAPTAPEDPDNPEDPQTPSEPEGNSGGADHEHTWTSASCMTRKRCVICREEGAFGDHQWRKDYFYDSELCYRSVCYYCKETDNAAHPHTWHPDMQHCAQECLYCRMSVPDPSLHEWIPVSCTMPEHCPHCGTQKGEALPHQYDGLICTLCRQIDPRYAHLILQPRSFYTVESDRISQWSLWLNGDAQSNGTLSVTFGKKIAVSDPNKLPEGQIVVYQGNYYRLDSGDDCPITYTINEKTITLTGVYSSFNIVLEQIAENQLKIISNSGSWGTPVVLFSPRKPFVNNYKNRKCPNGKHFLFFLYAFSLNECK